MASQTTTPAPGATDKGTPLSFMTKLSPVVYYYKPDPTSPPAPEEPTGSRTRSPRLLLLATWMSARDPHIAKYLQSYRVMFPSSPILLLRSETRHFLPFLPWKRRAVRREYGAAVPILRAVAEDVASSSSSSPTVTQGQVQDSKRPDEPEILIHIFSNGGSHSLTTVYNLFTRSVSSSTTATSSSPDKIKFPPHAIIFDSCPGLFQHRAGVSVMTQHLRPHLLRLCLLPFFHALSFSYFFLHILLGQYLGIPWLKGPLEKLAEGHNDTTEDFNGRARTEVRRVYVYGPGDKVIGEGHVEGHAGDAERRGLVVRKERFEGTGHVQHVRGDGERYWRVVGEVWGGVGF